MTESTAGLVTFVGNLKPQALSIFERQSAVAVVKLIELPVGRSSLARRGCAALPYLSLNGSS